MVRHRDAAPGKLQCYREQSPLCNQRLPFWEKLPIALSPYKPVAVPTTPPLLLSKHQSHHLLFEQQQSLKPAPGSTLLAANLRISYPNNQYPLTRPSFAPRYTLTLFFTCGRLSNTKSRVLPCEKHHAHNARTQSSCQLLGGSPC